ATLLTAGGGAGVGVAAATYFAVSAAEAAGTARAGECFLPATPQRRPRRTTAPAAPAPTRTRFCLHHSRGGSPRFSGRLKRSVATVSSSVSPVRAVEMSAAIASAGGWRWPGSLLRAVSTVLWGCSGTGG